MALDNPTFVTSTSANFTIVSSSGGTIAGAFILTVVFLLGVPGNIFVAWSILARTRRLSITTLLILHLACADGSLMVLTPFFIVYLVKQHWLFRLVMCKALFYLCCANMYASIFLITLMSLHRLVAVVWPHRAAALTARRTVVRMLLGLWVLALGLAVPVLVFRQLTPTNGSNMVCDSRHPEPRYVVLQYTMETLLGFVLPYGLILVSYICILRRIRQTQFRRRIRSEKLILAIVITFSIFWLPYHIINVVQVAAALCQEGPLKERLDHFWKSLRALASTVAFISSCINPVLYTLVGKSYIRAAGVAFMARLFDTAGLDSTSRKIRENSREDRGPVSEKEEKEQLRNKEHHSSTTTKTSSTSRSVQK